VVWVRAAVPLVVALLVSTGVHAQTASEILDDVDTFRSALDGTVYANVSIEAATPVALRLRAAHDGLRFTDAAGVERVVRVDDDTLPFEQRLLALVLTEQGLGEALDGLGVGFGAQLLSYEVFEPAGVEPMLVRRLGTATVSVTVEPGLARLREVRIRHDDGVYRVLVPRYSDLASGWYPERVEVRLDDQLLLALTATDVAPDAGALAPLPTVQRAPRIRFPRLPL